MAGLLITTSSYLFTVSRLALRDMDDSGDILGLRGGLPFAFRQQRAQDDEVGMGASQITQLYEDLPRVPRGDDDIHIIYSTDCGEYQDWQSWLLHYSVQKVGQKGPITRLASGCTQEQQDRLVELYQTLPENHRVHFTPDYSIDPKSGERFPYYNKPYSVKHFLAHSDPPVQETVIGLIDPDMILLRRLTPRVDEVDLKLIRTFHHHDDVRGYDPWVTEGHPVAQHYGLGGKWTSWEDLEHIVQDPFSPALRVENDEATQEYPAGPPYMAHTRDWVKLTEKWTNFVQRTFTGHPGILAEMYAFSIAAAHLEMPHTIARGYMVSNPKGAPLEKWEPIEAMDDSALCDPLTKAEELGMPIVLHYCQMYRLGKYMFGKRRPELHGIFECDGPLLEEPPKHVGTLRVRLHPRKRVEQVDKKLAARNAFPLCTITRMLNEAILDFRKRNCPQVPEDERHTPIVTVTDLGPLDLQLDRLQQLGAL